MAGEKKMEKRILYVAEPLAAGLKPESVTELGEQDVVCHC
uniref:Uncharacterized protein n=1 Tax=Fagus sylvatica TaxID=28930 RepID=A0A2N9IKQ8_FAGSY